MVHEAGTVEQHIHIRVARGGGVDGGGVQHIELFRRAALQILQQLEVDVGGDHLGAFSHEGFGHGAANALAGGGDEDGFAC